MSAVKKQIVNELHKPARRNFPRRKVLLKGIDDLWQSDLIEMIPYARINKGFRYILVVIDCFSKFSWALPIKRKSSTDVALGFTSILKGRRIPTNLQTDNGKEYFNSKFKMLMKQYNINHYATYSNIKASIAERVNRTIKSKLWKQFSLQGSYRWLDALKTILLKYNNTKHRTIGMKPSMVKGKKVERLLLETVYTCKKKTNLKKPKYSIDDYVRVSKFKAQFAKGYTPTWSTEIFKIRDIKYTNPVTYHLTDLKGEEIAGGFYEPEIQLVKFPGTYLVEKIIRKKGNKAQVKWLGLDSSHNSWVLLKNLNI